MLLSRKRLGLKREFANAGFIADGAEIAEGLWRRADRGHTVKGQGVDRRI